jgi:hypothetical protein
VEYNLEETVSRLTRRGWREKVCYDRFIRFQIFFQKVLTVLYYQILNVKRSELIKTSYKAHQRLKNISICLVASNNLLSQRYIC